MSDFRFSLLTLLVFVTVCALFAAGVHWFGPWGMLLLTIAAGTLIVVLLIWVSLHRLAPRATTYGTLMLFVLGFMLSLVVLGALGAREASRRNQCMENLRQLGRELHENAAVQPQKGKSEANQGSEGNSASGPRDE